MSERFVDVSFVDNFIAEQESKATLHKTQQDVKLLQTFLGTRNELRKVEDIPALELSEYISKFNILIRTKDEKDYEPSSLRSLLASFEWHLKKNSYSASLMNDLLFKKQEKSSYPNRKSKEKRKRKQAKRFESLNLWWIEYTLRVYSLYDSTKKAWNPEALLNTLC